MDAPEALVMMEATPGRGVDVNALAAALTKRGARSVVPLSTVPCVVFFAVDVFADRFEQMIGIASIRVRKDVSVNTTTSAAAASYILLMKKAEEVMEASTDSMEWDDEVISNAYALWYKLTEEECAAVRAFL